MERNTNKGSKTMETKNTKNLMAEIETLFDACPEDNEFGTRNTVMVYSHPLTEIEALLIQSDEQD